MGWFSGGNVLEDILDPAGAISAFSGEDAAEGASTQMDIASKRVLQGTKYSVDAQKEMFETARGDLKWARNMGETAGDAPGASQGMQDFEFSDAPDLGEKFGFDKEGPGKFDFKLDVDDEISKYKEGKVQEAVQKQMAASGNFGSSAANANMAEATRSFWSKEIDSQFNRQWQTYQTNAAEFQNEFNRSLTTFGTNQNQAKAQFGMTNAAQTSQYNKMANVNSIDNQNYWNQVNTGLAGSGQSANLAMGTGRGLSATYMQGAGTQADISMERANMGINQSNNQTQTAMQGIGLLATIMG